MDAEGRLTTLPRLFALELRLLTLGLSACNPHSTIAKQLQTGLVTAEAKRAAPDRLKRLARGCMLKNYNSAIKRLGCPISFA